MNEDVKNKYGFLYNGYKLKSYYWETVIMYRKVAMIFVSVFMKSLGTRVQSLAVFLIILVFIVVTFKQKPYLTRQLNDLEILSLLTSGISIYCGFFYLSSSNSQSSYYDPTKDFELSNGMKWILFVFIVSFNILFIFNWVYSFLSEIKDKFRAKAPKLYTCLCLCCRRSLYEQESKQSKARKQNEQLIDSIDNITEVLYDLRKKIFKTEQFADRHKFQKIVTETCYSLNKLNTNKITGSNQDRASVGTYRKVHFVNPNMKAKEEEMEVTSVQLNDSTLDHQITFEEIDSMTVRKNSTIRWLNKFERNQSGRRPLRDKDIQRQLNRQLYQEKPEEFLVTFESKKEESKEQESPSSFLKATFDSKELGRELYSQDYSFPKAELSSTELTMREIEQEYDLEEKKKQNQIAAQKVETDIVFNPVQLSGIQRRVKSPPTTAREKEILSYRKLRKETEEWQTPIPKEDENTAELDEIYNDLDL